MTKKILIIDDDKEDIESVRSVLEANKYDVSSVENGIDALSMIKKNKFDLIILDIKMPTLSGYDLLRLLREKLNHDVKMIYITIVPKKEVDLNDVDGFIQKPFSPSSLIKEVKKVLK